MSKSIENIDLVDFWVPKDKKAKEYRGGNDLENLMLLDSSFKTLLKSENREDYYKDNQKYARILKTLAKYK